MKTLEHYERKVDKTSPTGCWIWKGAREVRKDGSLSYGWISIDGKRHKAHRVFYMLSVGPIPDEKILRHRCDNVACVNPAHLLPGTQANNVQDRVDRGREGDRKGTKNGRAKLDETRVKALRSLAEKKVPTSVLAKRFDITTTTVRNIVLGKLWPHVGVP